MIRYILHLKSYQLDYFLMQPEKPKKDDSNWKAVNPLEATKVKAELQEYWKKRKRANGTRQWRESAAQDTGASLLQKVRGDLDWAVKKLKETQDYRVEQEHTIRHLRHCLKSFSNEQLGTFNTYHSTTWSRQRRGSLEEVEGALAFVTGERDTASSSAAAYHDCLAVLTKA